MEEPYLPCHFHEVAEDGTIPDGVYRIEITDLRDDTRHGSVFACLDCVKKHIFPHDSH